MAYIIGEIESVKRKVEFRKLSDSGKPAGKADMVVTFKVRSVDENKERMRNMQQFVTERTQQLAKAQRDPEYQLEFDEKDFDAEHLREDILNIDGIQDSQKNPVEFSPEVLEIVLQDRQARRALIEAWSDLNMEDFKGVKRKN